MAAIAAGRTSLRITARSANVWIPTTNHQRRKRQNVVTRIGRKMAIVTILTTTWVASTTVETVARRLPPNILSKSVTAKTACVWTLPLWIGVHPNSSVEIRSIRVMDIAMITTTTVVVNMMAVIVASKGMMVGMTSVLLANAWVWIVTRLSKSLGEMEEGVMENITMLDASLMEVIAARTLIAKNAKMILLLSKLDQLEHIDL